jgi:hypothetical protein
MKSSILKTEYILFMPMIVSGIILFACGSSRDAELEAKLDPLLRYEMLSQQDTTYSRIVCIVELNKSFDEGIKADFERSGVKVLTNFVTIVSIEGSVVSIRKVAALEYVKKIEVDRKSFPQK